MHQNMAQVSREIVKVRSEIAKVWILQFGAVRGSTSGRKGKPVGEMGLNGCYQVAPPSLEFCATIITYDISAIIIWHCALRACLPISLLVCIT